MQLEAIDGVTEGTKQHGLKFYKRKLLMRITDYQPDREEARNGSIQK